ncbi:MAG: single-stranded-DNA-specific exonuclease RecJ [Anaerolineae bacterium]|nr:single-stranded-DNA-specific exonuclease RecJ [Anaerolineae bacterium]
MKTWLEPAPVTVPDELAQLVGHPPIIGELLVRRGMETTGAAREYLNPDRYRPASPFDLPDMERAVERLYTAINRQEKIAVWGDFDVDGQTSTALLVSALRGLQADVSYYIPSRQTEGHGVHITSLTRLIDAGVKLIITCDTGISAHEAVDYAQSRGVDVIITDHHHLPPELPRAFAAINPQRLPVDHRLHTLPGVGTAYQLIRALAGDERRDLLDLVALGLVADVALLVNDARYLLQRGLEQLRHTERLGLRLLFEQAKLEAGRLTEEQIGFAIAPRLNALGRLGDANLAVDFLTTTDIEVARTLAVQIEGYNAERKLQVEQIYGAAQAQLERDRSLLDSSVLVLHHPQWTGGIIGIVANRLAEDYNRPVILLTTPPGQPARGSARSVAGIDITEALAEHRDLLLTFGGHTMAAGLSLDPERIPDLRRALARTVSKTLGQVATAPTLTIEGYVPLEQITPEFVAAVERLAPFGAGNPAPTFAVRDLALKSHTTVGRGSDHLRLTVEDREGHAARLIWWNGGGQPLPVGRFDVAFVPRMTDYKGERQLQIEWIDWRLTEGAVEVAGLPFQIVDHRGDSTITLDRLRAEHADLQVLGEPEFSRFKLERGSALAVWTIPPSPAELAAAVKLVEPQVIYLLDHDPDLNDLEKFLRRFLGLIKHTLTAKHGVAQIQTFAALMAHREATIRAALEWVESMGIVSITERNGDEVAISGGQGSGPADPTQTERMTRLLTETAAYRAHYRRATARHLF